MTSYLYLYFLKLSYIALIDYSILELLADKYLATPIFYRFNYLQESHYCDIAVIERLCMMFEGSRFRHYKMITTRSYINTTV
ncbi:hypothetical protein GDO78_018809 [Eleutherodactylus coqui]|uniref:Uncharacterized protein n=1 Tax=Eleutherodactylus coqui TaxID=57060 RepID=A0A8J6B0M2_ELECQ|nr:hypothetical protein GDO78_018809 [Eleutherodactylus coqui]